MLPFLGHHSSKYRKHLFMHQLFGFLSSLLLLGLSNGVSAELRVGGAAVDITPVLGTPMQAPQRPPFEVRLSEAAHDPLQIKAIVLEVDGLKAALVVCDVTSLPTTIVEAARREIGETTNLDSTSVMISATHTHTAPQLPPFCKEG